MESSYNWRMTQQEVLAGLADVLARGFPEIPVAILYGSRAKGSARPDSDVDLGVACHPWRPMDPERLLDLSLAAGTALGLEVQVRDLAGTQGLLLMVVLREGVPVFKPDPEVHGLLVAKALGYAQDFLPQVRRMQEAALRRAFG